jgi:epoxyqueuosine reductase
MNETISSHEIASAIKARALELGFDMCGICEAQPSAFKAEYREWLEAGMHGEMGYLARDPERRLDPELVMPGARSIIVVAMNYYTEEPPASPDLPGSPTISHDLPQITTNYPAKFARYARGNDYHDVMGARLKELLAWLRMQTDEPFDARVYVDTGPLLEREIAQRAGIGWFGKNTMLINTWRGSYFLLGEILTTLELPPDEPAIGGCGTCTKCLDACPTGAIVAPFKVDARKCISYLTIENKGSIPEEFAGKLNGWVFGCDICQEVCPFNERRASPTSEPAFQPRETTVGRTLGELAEMTEEEFRVAFKGSPVKRAKWRGLMRNVEAAVSASVDPVTENG